jgi:hypothetical protein
MRAGRHKHRPTDEQRRQVTLLSGYGLQQEQIATFINVAPKTLRLRYRRELDLGVVQANAQVAKSLFEMATRDKVPSAAIFWLKARANWRDRDPLDSTQDTPPTSIHFTWAEARQDAQLATNPAAPTIDGTVEAEDEQAGGVIVRWRGE